MKIDQTRYKAFWQNPDRYRLVYEKNVVPRTMAYGLARGSAFHVIADCKAAGMEDSLIREILAGLRPDPQGRMLALQTDAVENAWVLWRAFEQAYPPGTIPVVAHEREFEVPIGIPSARHSLVGRLDQIVEYQGRLWVGEMKTAYGKATYDRVLADWNADVQADFVLLGARALDFDVRGVLVRYVVEKVPPTCFPPLEVTRSEHRLKRTQFYVYQTCEIIEMLKATFGIDYPWPHLANWPCNNPDKCEFSTICGRAFDEIEPEELEMFKEREEHLQLLRGETGGQ